ncbi:uncharacterized protein B0I36DRAFT_370024 [Microdochium trichocladiopsis]|uniref:Uncharacterized protein n=1 Tax=Microdochium trichocladiopsis TaxID=1682393 RepID=A0A9P9BIK4_9PEZI|nr:uncharacterized protein B0I36DRAFT_370024 [Microdochium trichocladiopsis]KAH7012257.1 hypothetical protein B0I36DRAFT_370024 [Microdochium trichocladiopsis]
MSNTAISDKNVKHTQCALSRRDGQLRTALVQPCSLGMTSSSYMVLISVLTASLDSFGVELRRQPPPPNTPPFRENRDSGFFPTSWSSAAKAITTGAAAAVTVGGVLPGARTSAQVETAPTALLRGSFDMTPTVTSILTGESPLTAPLSGIAHSLADAVFTMTKSSLRPKQARRSHLAPRILVKKPVNL